MQAVVKKVVYTFRYRPGPGQVGREVFHMLFCITPKSRKQLFLSIICVILYAENQYSPRFIIL